MQTKNRYTPATELPERAVTEISLAIDRVSTLTESDVSLIQAESNKSWTQGYGQQEHARATHAALSHLGNTGGYDISHEIQHLADSAEITSLENPVDAATLTALTDYLAATLAAYYGGFDRHFTTREYEQLRAPWRQVA